MSENVDRIGKKEERGNEDSVPQPDVTLPSLFKCFIHPDVSVFTPSNPRYTFLSNPLLLLTAS